MLARTLSRILVCLLVLAFFGTIMPQSVTADTITIDCSPDTLRDELERAMVNQQDTIINLAPEPCTYAMVMIDPDFTYFQPIATGLTITLNGNGASITRSNQSQTKQRFFEVQSGATLILNDLILSGGELPPHNNGSHSGGAIFVHPDATLYTNGVRFNSNRAGDGSDIAPPTSHDGSHGGAIFNDQGTLFINRTIFNFNRSGNGVFGGDIQNGPGDGGDAGHGGAIYTNQGTVYITDSVFSSNYTGRGGNGGNSLAGGNGGAGGHGGAIFNNNAQLIIRNSDFIGNATQSFTFNQSAGNGGNGHFLDSFAGAGGNGGHGGIGGAIYSSGNPPVQITYSRFENNKAGAGGHGGNGGTPANTNAGDAGHAGDGGIGGALYAAQGNLLIQHSSFSGNQAGAGGNGGNGGPGWNGHAGDGGRPGAGGPGGAIALYGTQATLMQTSILSNTAGAGGAAGTTGQQHNSQYQDGEGYDGGLGGHGGGVYIARYDQQAATVNLHNTTISGNHSGNGGIRDVSRSYTNHGYSGNGGGVMVDLHGNSVMFIHTTLVSNTIGTVPPGSELYGSGGGIAVASLNQQLNQVMFQRSIIAGNKRGTEPWMSNVHNCVAAHATTLLSNGTNIFGDDAGCPVIAGDQTIAHAAVYTTLLTPLADHGGLGLSHDLLATSPARDALQTPCLPFDQRGIARPQATNCDLGAIEYLEPAARGELELSIATDTRFARPGSTVIFTVEVATTADINGLDLRIQTSLGTQFSPNTYQIRGSNCTLDQSDPQQLLCTQAQLGPGQIATFLVPVIIHESVGQLSLSAQVRAANAPIVQAQINLNGIVQVGELDFSHQVYLPVTFR